MTLCDSHAHYDDSAFDGDRDSLLAGLPGRGVALVVNVGCDLESSHRSAQLAGKYGYIYGGAGIHPAAAGRVPEGWRDELRAALALPRMAVLGEIGLDYHYDSPPRDTQIAVFRAQMEMARELGLPVSVHERDAHADALAIVREFPGVRGVFHCFSGSVPTALELIERGWHIGFTGVVTFKNARRAVEVAAAIPEERILIETDCPYLAPDPFRGKRSDSSMLRYTAEKIAEIRGTDAERIARITLLNTRRAFGIKE